MPIEGHFVASRTSSIIYRRHKDPIALDAALFVVLSVVALSLYIAVTQVLEALRHHEFYNDSTQFSYPSNISNILIGFI